MNYTDLHYQTALSLLFGIGPRRGKELIQKLDSLEQLFHDDPKNLAKRVNFKAEFFKQMDRFGALETADHILQFNARNNVESIFFEDERFPYRLNQVPDGPLMLFARGACDWNEKRTLAIVGTRDPSEYGQEVTRRLVESCQDRNIVTISGLAYGIDTWAHRYSLDFNIPTVAVLGHGLDRIYPDKNRSISQLVLEAGGVLLTEFPPGTNPDRENFPKRNRIVAGMSDATVVVESKRSGGSLITARLANDYNRDVFAVPGNITKESSRGCNMLIENDEAHLFESPNRFLKKMGWADTAKKQVAIQRELFVDLSESERRLYTLIQESVSTSVDKLSIQCSLPVSQLQSELFMLELKGLIKNNGGNNIRVV